MSRPEPSIVDEAGAAAIEAARESLGDNIRTIVEYDAEEYNLIYISEWLREHLGEESIEETTRQLHGYVHLDFVERELFGDLTPVAGEVRANITRLERATFVRYLVDDDAIFLSIDPDADVTALCEAMDAALAAAREE